MVASVEAEIAGGPAERPGSREELAELLGRSAAEGARVRPRGGGTKLGWGSPASADLEVSTLGLDRTVEHNAGDLTAVLEAGVPLARAQAAFAADGQMLALDPPLGADDAATVGGVVACADSGPLRHRYGSARDLVIGVSVALADGTVAKAGGRVIKNVAGYDLAKLLAGSFGTLGVIVEVCVRLHPLPARTATIHGASGDPELLARAASELAHARLEMQSLDVRWASGQGAILARFGGESAAEQAGEALPVLAEAGIAAELLEEDDEEEEEGVWSRQRAGQRSPDGAVVRVSGRQAELARVLRVAERLEASVVGRAALGLSWVALPPADPEALAAAVEELRTELAPSPCAVLDGPAELRARIDPWGRTEDAELELMRRVKARFDPEGICNRGLFVGGI